MDLLNITKGVINTVNPNQLVSIQVSTGYANVNGKRTPQYAPPLSVSAQVQEKVSLRDLTQLEAMNIQGTKINIYLEGSYDSIVRVNRKGGDLITLADGTIWLTVLVPEKFPNWCRVVATLQNGS